MKRHILGITMAVSIGLTAPASLMTPAVAATKAPVRKAAATPAQSGAMRLGIQNYNRGFVAKAIPLFEQATRQNPNNEMAFLWLARSYQKQGTPSDFAKSKANYQKVLAINPSNVEALSNLGEMWSWDPAMRSESIQLLRQANGIKPSDPAIARKLAEALFWNGNTAEALQVAAPIANRYASDHKWMGEYAQMLSANGHADEALEIYNTTLKEESGRNIDMKLDVARALNKSGQRQQAQALFGEIQASVDSSAAAKNPDTINALASLAFDLEMYTDSLKWDQTLPDSYQRQKDIQLRQARALTHVFRTPEAIEKFNHLYEAGLLTASEKLEFAEYLRQLNLEGAALPSPNLMENLYREAAQESPNSGAVALGLARQYAQEENRFDDTVKAYQMAISNGSGLERAAAKKEFLDYLKTDKAHGEEVEGLFKEMIAQDASDNAAKGAYAEYLSWQPERRTEAMRMYVELAKASPADHDFYEARIEDVLKWHQPTTELIPLYQEIVNEYPQNKMIWLTVARAYRGNKDYYKEAVETYGTLVKRYGDDATIKKEWLDLLVSNAKERNENISLLKKMIQEEPSDMDILATYGKLLSYQHKYGPAMDAFEKVLNQNPEHREALVGKGYTILWSGRKLEAKEFFQHLRGRYPDDVDIAIGLAQTDKLIGRYDEALRIIQEIKPLMDRQGQKMPQQTPEAGDTSMLPTDALGDYRLAANFSGKRNAPIYDFSILPYSASSNEPDTAVVGLHASNSSKASRQPASSFVPLLAATLPDDLPVLEPLEDLPPVRNVKPVKPVVQAAPFTVHFNSDAIHSQATEPVTAVVQPATADDDVMPVTRSDNPQMREIRSEITALNDAVTTLKLLQQSSAAQLEHLDHTIQVTKDAVPSELSLQPADESRHSQVAAYNASASGSARRGAGSMMMVGEGGMTPVYGTYTALDSDTNPLLSGLGRFRNDDLADLEKGLLNDLRPMVRAGFLFSRQDGEDTTTKIHGWGFPNQVSLSLTPQVRVRGGIQPTNWYLPNGVSPDSSWGIQYGAGATIKYWDRLTLDGDIAVTHFTQSKSENVTFQAEAKYDFNDSISAKLGVRRIPQYNSLVTLTGLEPGRGAFRGDLVGQARENGIYGELNTHPFSPNVDWNLGYEWAFIDGSHVRRNYKNQVFTSLGYTWHYATNHQARLGYEFLYFGYGKNATNGFYDTTAAGNTQPVVSLRPVALADSAYTFGGYYSPSVFLMNAARLDLRGSFFNKFLEYKLGGSLGAQTVRLGHGLHGDGNGTSLSSAFDANVILNFTDWLAAYGDVDFLDAGGQFNRWRFGGGLILRPHINALSPVFGQPTSPAAKSSESQSPPTGG